ncbi:Cu/Ag efflux protein CusF [Bradyrhizobium sp. LA8.1]
MNRTIRIAAALALTVGLAAEAFAAQGAAISGEVKKIDEGAGKITSTDRRKASAWMNP